MLLAELERQERELREMQAMHDNIAGTKPGSASTSGENAASGSGSASMDTAQDGEGADSSEQEEVDARSVYVGNVSFWFPDACPSSKSLPVSQVDYGATPEELQEHFQASGAINRITILCDKFTGHPKGWVCWKGESF
jgi:polyadenylate-binding protein 2